MRDMHLKRKLKYTEKARVRQLAACYIKINDWGNIIVSIIIETSKCITSKIKSWKIFI